MNDTPRTDAAWHAFNESASAIPFRDFARELERELATANAERDRLKAQCDAYHAQGVEVWNVLNEDGGCLAPSMGAGVRELKDELDAKRTQNVALLKFLDALQRISKLRGTTSSAIAKAALRAHLATGNSAERDNP